MTQLFYVHDPMCSWCWAYSPIMQRIVQNLQNHPIVIHKIVGGLAPDSDEPMARALQKQIQMTWKRIEQEVGAQFNHDFWRECEPRRSTYPACRAVIAARNQQAEDAMLLAIQQAYYLRAMNPSDDDTLLQLADELDLDFDRFAEDLASAATETVLQKEVALAQSMPINGFPSWVLLHNNQYHSVSLDYHSHLTTLAALGSLMKS